MDYSREKQRKNSAITVWVVKGWRTKYGLNMASDISLVIGYKWLTLLKLALWLDQDSLDGHRAVDSLLNLREMIFLVVLCVTNRMWPSFGPFINWFKNGLPKNFSHPKFSPLANTKTSQLETLIEFWAGSQPNRSAEFWTTSRIRSRQPTQMASQSKRPAELKKPAKPQVASRNATIWWKCFRRCRLIYLRLIYNWNDVTCQLTQLRDWIQHILSTSRL